MKALKLFSVAILSLLALSAGAQADSTKNKKSDTTRIQLGNTNITIIEDEKGNKSKITVANDSNSVFNFNSDSLPSLPEASKSTRRKSKKMQNVWFGIDLGVNTLLNADRSFSLTGADAPYSLDYGKSINVNLNLYEQKVRIIKNNLYLSTGLGLEFNNFRFDNTSVRLNPNASPLDVSYDTTRNYTKNKLALAYLNVPLLLTVATNNKKGKNDFHISFGAMVGFKYRSHQKLVYFEDGKKEKPKEFDNFNLNPFRFTAMARMGYKNLGVYANYSLNQLFLKNQGPELYPLTMGVSLLF